MATPRFYLKDKNKKRSLIYTVLHINYKTIDITGKTKNKRFAYSTRETIQCDQWDNKKQRAKNSRIFADLNQRLTNIELTIIETVRRLQNEKIKITPQILKNELDKVFQRQPEIIPIDLLSFIKQHIETATTVYLGNTPQPIKPQLKKRYLQTYKLLCEFATHLNKKTFDFTEIDNYFYEKFIRFMYEQKNYSGNYASKNISILKTFLNVATNKGINSNLSYKEFKTFEKAADTIYLTMQELNDIYSLDLSNNKPFEIAKDLFLIQCDTALRHSDLIRLKKEHFNISDNTLSIRTQKTGKPVIIPLTPRTKKILEKYNYQLPTLQQHRYNKRIKYICKLAGINQIIIITINKGGKLMEKRHNKYELVSSHTARRTGATNLYKCGVPVQSIMKITAHTKETIFMRYLKISAEDNANLIKDNKFFKQGNIRIS